MPSDEEFRRVAEDLRGLARSLARDLRAAADDVRQSAKQGFQRHQNEVRDARDRERAARRAYKHGQRPWGPYVGPPMPPHYRARRHWESKWGTPLPYTAPNGSATTTAPAPVPAPRPPKPKRMAPPLRHRRDGSTLLGGLALVFGLAWLITRIHLASPSAETIIALALMLVGGAMVVTARTDWALSRRAWPALIGGVLVIAALSASPSFGLGNWSDFRVGDHSATYTSWAEVPSVIKGGVGHTDIDLTGVHDPLPADRTIEIRNTVGEVEVEVPAGVRTIVDAHLAVGDIQLNGQSKEQGVRPKFTQTFSPDIAGPTLTLKISGGPGALKINQPKPIPPTSDTSVAKTGTR